MDNNHRVSLGQAAFTRVPSIQQMERSPTPELHQGLMVPSRAWVLGELEQAGDWLCPRALPILTVAWGLQTEASAHTEFWAEPVCAMPLPRTFLLEDRD